jgi:hypothetical protein
MKGWFGRSAAALALMLVALATPAQAAFPGRDGLLAVQPMHGSGLVLVNADGRGETHVCAQPASGGTVCSLTRPMWSPDGRYMSAGAAGADDLAVIYPDGSCLYCGLAFGFPADATFTSNPTVLTAVSTAYQLGGNIGLFEYGFDGLLTQAKALVRGSVSDPTWSSKGELAVVRGRWILAGPPGHLRRLTRGRVPSWSPNGGKIAFEQNGWVTIVRIRGRAIRRLVRGSAPTWSPDGRWIALFAGRDRLSIIRVGGGRLRRVGVVSGRTVDWQPLPASPPAACSTPPGSTVIARNDSAIISRDSDHLVDPQGIFVNDGWAAIACELADGREHVIDAEANAFEPEGETTLSNAVLAGNYVALLETGGGKGCSAISYVKEFDVRTGRQLPNRELQIGCDYSTNFDQFVLGDDAVMAVHSTQVEYICGNPSPGADCTVEKILASDSTGVHTLDSINEPNGSAAALTNLTLSGDTLTWDHNGAPRSAELQP